MDSPILNTIELCAGVGMLGEGLAAGLRHMGINSRCILYAEREAYPASVLGARMEEGSLHPAPVWFGDFTRLPAAKFRGLVDCIVAGFPCQDLSVAGRRAGLDGKRSGLFFEVVRIATDSGAWSMFLENVNGIHSATATVMDAEEGELEERAAARVVGELADLGWNAEWITLPASDVGASHGRARWFCWAWRMADSTGRGLGELRQSSGSRGQPDGGNTDMVHAGHKYQHLQQRANGAEHSGAGQPVDSAGCVQRRTGHEQDRPGSAETCGHEANDRAADRGSDVAHTGCSGARRIEHITGASGIAPEYQPGIGAVADASDPRLQGSEQRRACHDHWGGGRKHMDQLSNFVAYSPLAHPTRDGEQSSPSDQNSPPPSPKRLNPYFVEWLMGWPLNWTSETVRPVSGPVETELWRSKLQQQLSSLFDEQGD